MKNIFDPNFRKIKPTEGKDYTIPQVDLSVKPDGLDPKFDYLYDLVTVDNSKPYQAHPDSVLLKNGNILCMYPAGHGKGAVMTKISTDGGLTYCGRQYPYLLRLFIVISVKVNPSSESAEESTTSTFAIERST